MEYRLAAPKGKDLSTKFGVMSYSIGPGNPLWEAIEVDDLSRVQALSAKVVESGVNLFSVTAPVVREGSVALTNVIGLGCEFGAVESTVWFYQQAPTFLPLESYKMCCRGWFAWIENPEEDEKVWEISRRCLEWDFTNLHARRIKAGLPLKSIGGGPNAVALCMEIGLRMQAAHEQESLNAATPGEEMRRRPSGRLARL